MCLITKWSVKNRKLVLVTYNIHTYIVSCKSSQKRESNVFSILKKEERRKRTLPR